MRAHAVFVLLAGLTPAAAIAADCNYDKPINACQARIDINSAGGSKPSFWAEITVSSNAPTCSKVEYLLDNTPHTALLRGSNSDGESLSGTKAITRQSIRVQRCTAYEDRELVAKRQSPKEVFNGQWSGTGTRSGFASFPSSSRFTTISISVNGSSASLNIGNTRYSGRASGNQISVSKNWDNSFTESISVTLNGDGSISVSGSGAPSNFSGNFTRD